MKIKTSLHNHTTFSDGKKAPREMVEEAIKRGFTHFAITDHVETIGFDGTLKRKDYELYINEVSKLKEQYKDKINLSLGIEGEYYMDEGFLVSDISNIRDRLDFVVGSTHHVNQGKDIRAVDDTFELFLSMLKTFYDNDVRAMVTDYFKGYNQMLDALSPEICGHIDLVKKNNIDNMFFKESDNWYKKLIDEALEHIKEIDAVMELNTGGACRAGFRAIYPSDYALKKANDMGIKMTVCSDAHDFEMLDTLYDLAISRMKNSGVNTLYTYDSNIHEFISFAI